MSRVPESLRRSFDKISPDLEFLKKRAEYQLQDIANLYQAQYEGRVKTVESILSKIESGKQYESLTKIEDLFAATIAVPSLDKIQDVIAAVQARFEVVKIKSHRDKNPREFVYDDLHMILKLKDDALIINKNVLEYKFELQIKTLLQLAWWRLEHDLVYKTTRLSWQKSRVFGQIRALFELADSMLSNIEEAASLQSDEQFPDYISINNLAEILETKWEDKPWYDLRRTAETVLFYCRLANIDLDQLTNILQEAVNQDVLAARSITPSQAILIALYRFNQREIISNLQSEDCSLYITEEMLEFFPALKDIPRDKLISLP